MQNSSPAAASAAASKKRAKKPAKEKRLKRFRSKPTIAISQRIQRALTQRLYLIKTSEPSIAYGGPSIAFTVLGSTGNVYEVALSKVPACNCPDHRKGNLCKHLLFVMLKVVGLSSSSPLVYQSAYLTEELEEIVKLVQTRMSNLGVGGGSVNSAVVANASVQEQFVNMQTKKSGDGDDGDKDTKSTGVQRKEIEGSECPICFDSLGGRNMSLLTYCQATCGTNFHKECIRMWTSQHSSNPTCPACRQQWTDTKTGGKESPKKKAANEGYVNLGRLQGQSPVRDTSTYNDRWDGYKRRRY